MKKKEENLPLNNTFSFTTRLNNTFSCYILRMWWESKKLQIATDPTVRVSALSVYEAFASTDPLAPEIVNILGKHSNVSMDLEFPQTSASAVSGADDDEAEVEEIEFDDLTLYESEIELETDEGSATNTNGPCSLIQACLKNIGNEVQKRIPP